ncbi:hypothetical protein G6F37_001356 [Rhizopus arrhizus]|nr:hypothetical protein G6F38_002017 [Rhizopus arrhizus]KAG1163291.1 hypothetical protein G6F37_001356 [Rhizopus arrhizus]
MIDDETYPLDSVTNYDQYIDLKPPEKQVINKENVERTGEFLVEAHSTWKGGRTYRKYSDEDKEYFFELVYEKGLRVSQAAMKLGIPTWIAQGWYDKDQKDPQDIIQRKTAQNSVRRPPSLGEEHRIFLVDHIDKKPSLTLDEIMDGLSAQFMDLSISKTAVYNFVKEKCRISLKKAYFHSAERNSFENIERRYKWIKRWMETDMDYLCNCIFIDEAAFHINMKRTVAWSKIGSRTEIVMPKARAKTTTILEAISPYGVINVKVRRPRVVNQNKKRKAGGGKAVINTQSRGGTVTGHYFNFICGAMDALDKREKFKDCYIETDNAPTRVVTGHYLSFLKAILDEMDMYPEMKGYSLVMDNAPIHSSIDIEKYIHSRGYLYVYLPLTSELNPTEQFWSVVKMRHATVYI